MAHTYRDPILGIGTNRYNILQVNDLQLVYEIKRNHTHNIHCTLYPPTSTFCLIIGFVLYLQSP